MAEFSQRDKSRTTAGKTRNLVRKHTNPPRPDKRGESLPPDQRWQWFTSKLMSSIAFRSLSTNAFKGLFRVIIEHNAHAALENGKLVVTHSQFIEYGVTGEYVGDAIDELEYKGLVLIRRGRAGAGTAHPNVFTLTFVGDYEGAAATNDWRRCTAERCHQWIKVDRALAKDRREKVGRKKKSSLRDSEIRRASQ